MNSKARWRRNNKGRIKRVQAEWRARNPDKVKNAQSKWLAKNPTYMSTYCKRWCKAFQWRVMASRLRSLSRNPGLSLFPWMVSLNEHPHYESRIDSPPTPLEILMIKETVVT